MKTDIILAGVGGQGVLSIAAIIARGAVKAGLRTRQSEVHGMAQRGGAVLAHLRVADSPIHSDLTPQGAADLIIAMEPLESLRYLRWLSPHGAVVTAAEPFRNIDPYPDLHLIIKTIESLPSSRIIHAEALAKAAGFPKAVNMVMVGAAFPFLPIPREQLEAAIDDSFSTKDPAVAAANRKAFALAVSAAGGGGTKAS
ncbi:MAG: indolepyruvate oxidoreductase subunit beta [Spirochaetaceae bacterium]|jgi:indolepyruvate ferredoxin oxidoreductase beta subunit|nr:indolepyruvate oxidoreductase subunit beta [Spirochaetaceae bacterium]